MALLGCEILYSEDLQHGRVIGGLTIRNPFVESAP
jgi:predicted nucleic acid-binding protein